VGPGQEGLRREEENGGRQTMEYMIQLVVVIGLLFIAGAMMNH
jgi:hypothetical protein